MLIREATINDSEELCEICKNELGYDCNPDLVSQRLSNLDFRRERVFVAKKDNNVVGFVHVETYNLLYSESFINILGLAVDSKYKRQRIGKALMNTAENWGVALGISCARLNSGTSRKSAHDFYRAIGYDNEKEQIRFIKKIPHNCD
jgi:predicted N-acetyltransferase YhbS